MRASTPTRRPNRIGTPPSPLKGEVLQSPHPARTPFEGEGQDGGVVKMRF